MAVLPMKRISICAMKKNRKQLLEFLQQRGVIEISDGTSDDEVFKRTDMSSASAVFQKNIAAASQSLEILDSYIPEKKSMLSALEGRKDLNTKDFDAFTNERDKILAITHRLIALQKQITESNASIPKLSAQLEALAPWLSLDVPLDFKGTKKTTAFIGTLSEDLTEEQLYSKITELAPSVEFIHADVISHSKEQTCIFVVSSRSDSAAVEEALRTLGFARPSHLSSLTPTNRKSEIEEEIKTLQQETNKAIEEIKSYDDKRSLIEFIIDYYTMRSDKYDVISRLTQSKNVFLLTGYIPECEADSLEKTLTDSFDLALEFSDPSEDEDTPVVLKNNPFSEPVEGVLKAYSYPAKGEIDPTFLMSLFYYFLFGLMLSDAAYGLIMVLGCGFCLAKFKNMEIGTRKTLSMFFFCGISTTFWGILFGSWFGDVVKVVSTTFFGHPITLGPLWFEPVSNPMRMLVFSMLIGIIHIYVGLAANLYQCLHTKRYKDALYDVIFWYVLVTSLIVMLLSTQQFVNIAQLSFILPASVGNIAGIVAFIAALGIILTAGRESRSWFKRILKGLYGLYNVTGYLSDVLSYSRLLALGLATGVIATVINQMGSMGGRSISGVVLFIIVFILGHSINIGINLLGAYVHTNRLQFVEFFGKFYQGGGREFNPFTANTKYYKIKEETNHG